MQLWPVEHFFPHKRVPVVVYFLQNPYFRFIMIQRWNAYVPFIGRRNPLWPKYLTSLHVRYNLRLSISNKYLIKYFNSAFPIKTEARILRN